MLEFATGDEASERRVSNFTLRESFLELAKTSREMATLLANGSTPSDAKVERLAERIAVKHQKCSLKPHPLETGCADVKSNARTIRWIKKAGTRHRLGSTVLKLRNVFLIRKIAAGLLIEEQTRRLVVIVFRFWH